MSRRPWVVTYWRYGGTYTEEFRSFKEAFRWAVHREDEGELATEKITSPGGVTYEGDVLENATLRYILGDGDLDALKRSLGIGVRPRTMKRSDITDDHVLELARATREGGPGVIPALLAEGVPPNLALAKVLHMCKRGLLDYGVSPNYAWPVER